VNIKIAGKWMFIPLKMVLIGIDPYPFLNQPGLGVSCIRLQNRWFTQDPPWEIPHTGGVDILVELA